MYSNNEYAGIGVTIQLDDKTKGFRITAVTSDSPAAKAGLKQGDIIMAIDGEDVTGKTLSDVQSTIRAKLNKRSSSPSRILPARARPSHSTARSSTPTRDV